MRVLSMSAALSLLSWITLAFLVFQGNADPLILVDIAHDQIAMSSEISDAISTMKPFSEQIVQEDELIMISEPDNSTIKCFPYVSQLNSTNNSESDKAEECKKQGCAWYPRGTGKNWESYCFTPKDYGYIMEGNPEKIGDRYRIRLKKSGAKTYFGNDSQLVILTVELQSDYRLRFIFADETPRWEVFNPNPPKETVKDPLYDIAFINDPLFTMRITRKSSGIVIFDTSLGGLTFSDQFLQIATKLPSKNIYGFGEHRQPAFRHEFKGEYTWPMYSRGMYNESKGNPAVNLNGVHPYYTVVENDGNSHSVMIVNSNAQEMQLLPVPGLIFRTSGGILDFYLFLGPTPDETVQQLTEAIGRPFLPPYYSLGVQVGKQPFSILEDVKDLLESIDKNKLPIEILYENQNELMTYYKQNASELADFVMALKEKGIHYMTTLTPFVFDDIENSTDNNWIKDSKGNPVKGLFNSKLVKYPDFSRETTLKWWAENIQDLMRKIGFESLDLVHNEPYNDNMDCSKEDKWNKPPWKPSKTGDCLSYNTISADSQQDAGKHYDLHSLYGWSQSKSTMEAMQKSSTKRPLLLSQSTFLGSGQWSGYTFNNNIGVWSDLHMGIIQLLQFNQFGIPYVGSNIKILDESLNKNSDEFHLRWMQIQAFNPLARIPNALNLQTASTKVVEGLKKVLQVRYRLLPYYYTLMYLAHTKGNTVIRPLWHEFRKDPVTYDIDRQFMLGTGFLVSPVLEQGLNSVEAYIPRDRWYDYYTGVELTERGRHVILDAPEDKIPLLIRGYHIIPTQHSSSNTEFFLDNNFTLIVALCAKGNGKGQLYVDDGISIDSIKDGKYFLAKYSVTNKTVEGTIEHDGFPEISSKYLSTIRLLGAADVKTVSLNGNLLESVKLTPGSAETLITGLNVPINSNFTLTWTTGGNFY